MSPIQSCAQRQLGGPRALARGMRTSARSRCPADDGGRRATRVCGRAARHIRRQGREPAVIAAQGLPGQADVARCVDGPAAPPVCFAGTWGSMSAVIANRTGRRRARRGGLPLVNVAALRPWFVVGCVGALGVAGCGGGGARAGGGGGGSASLKLGQAATLARPGNQTTSFKEYKYKTAVVSVTQAGPNDLKNETILGNSARNRRAVRLLRLEPGVP